MDYKQKYLKYKQKYLKLKGGLEIITHSNEVIKVGDNNYNLKKIINDLNKIKKPSLFVKNLKIIFNNKKYNIKKKIIRYTNNLLLDTNNNYECKLNIEKLNRIGINVDKNLIKNENINQIIVDECKKSPFI